MSPEKVSKSEQEELPKIGLTNNVIFRHVFASRERKGWLLALINALLELEGQDVFEQLEIIDSIQSREHLQDRDAVVDIIAVDGHGTQIHVEVQLINHPGFVARILYYWAKLYSRQLNQAEPFAQLRPTISLVITDFYVSEDEQRLHAHWGLSCRHTKEPRSNLLALHFVQLPALNEKDLKSRIKKWVYAFKHGREILDSKEIPSLLLDEKELVMAIEEAKKALVTDEDLRQRALSQEMMMRTQISIVAENVEAALKRGLEQGLQRGELEGKLKILLMLFRNGSLPTEAAEEQMRSLLGQNYDELVQSFLGQLL
ncbi:MAG: Rpn family recombination-promoting nuclease/putative transposase [Candidatus Cloacimonetes bacterium]|nr:Rpn family recombination-promoting nuclease/putative transposase [Candidatus Cloacimonadota bacterium]